MALSSILKSLWYPETRIAIILGLIALYNIALTTISLIAAATMRWPYYQFWNTFWSRQGEDVRYTAIFFFFCTIPLMTTILSFIDVYKKWKHALRPRAILFHSVFAIVGLAICCGVWTPCLYTKKFSVGDYSQPDWFASPMYCPMGSGPRFIKDDYNHNLTYSVAYVLPWSIIIIEVFYMIYLIFGLMAMYKERQQRDVSEQSSFKPLGSEQGDERAVELSALPNTRHSAHICYSCGQDVPKPPRYTGAYSFATTQDTLGNDCASTVRSSMMSSRPAPALGLSTITSLHTLPRYPEDEDDDESSLVRVEADGSNPRLEAGSGKRSVNDAGSQ